MTRVIEFQGREIEVPDDFTDDQVRYVLDKSTPVSPLAYPKEFVKSGAEGFKGVAGSGLQGLAVMHTGLAEQQLAKVNAEPPPVDVEDPFERAAARRRAEVHPSAEAVRARREQYTAQAERPVTEHPLHQAGTAVEEFGKDYTAPGPGFQYGSHTRALGSGFGSVAGNIATSLLPGGTVWAPAMLLGGGAGEAYERAKKSGATEAQARTAGQYGMGAGATDLADIALLRVGVNSKAAARAIARVVEGSALEGSQEGLQQFIQNLIAKGIYKPDQDKWEDVIYNAIIGGIVGGTIKGAFGGERKGAELPPPPATEAEADAALNVFTGPQPPAGGAPQSGVPGPQQAGPGVPGEPIVLPEMEVTPADTGVPPPTGPGDYGVGPRSDVPPTGATLTDVGPDTLGATAALKGGTPAGTTAPMAAPTTTEAPIVPAPAPVPVGEPPPMTPGTLPVPPPPIDVVPTEPTVPPTDPFEQQPWVEPKPQEPEVAKTIGDQVADFMRTTRGFTLPPDSKYAPPSEGELLQDLSDVQTNPGFAMRTAALLGANLYGGPDRLSNVTVKEIVQNSFDSLKGLLERGEEPTGDISIEVDPKARTVTVVDDGAGIPLQVLAGPFLQVGGTHKTTKRASGGHGIAKMAFIFGNENMRVTTMHDGVVYSLESKGQALFDYLEHKDEKKRPLIKRREPTRADRALFPKGHGTAIEVKLPENYVDPSTGLTKPIPIAQYDFQHPVLTRSPLFNDIEVKFNDKVLPIGKHFPIQDFTPMMNIKFGWGTARIVVSKAKDPNPGYENVHVLSNGLWQFSTKIKKPGSYNNLPYTFYVDVAPKVESGQPGYPFSLDRQQFSPRVSDDFLSVFNYISVLYELKDYVSSVQNYGDMQYMYRDAAGKVVVGNKTRVELTAPPPTTALTHLNPGDSVQIEDGKLIVNGKVVPEITPQEMESFKIDYKALRIPQDKIDSRSPIFHDNTVAKISDIEERTVSDMARERFGVAFDQYVMEFGELFLELRNAAAALMDRRFPGKDYLNMKDRGVGVSFDPKYRGVSITIPFYGEFVNIAVPEAMDNPIIAGLATTGTMVHELAHFRERDESEGHGPFAAEMQRLTYTLQVHDIDFFSLHEFQQRVVDLMARNWDIQQYIHGVMTDGTYVIRSRGQRFSDDSNSQSRDPQGTPGGAAEDVGETGEGRGPSGFVSGRSPDGSIGFTAEPDSSGSSEPIKRIGYVAGVGENLNDGRAADQRILDSEDPGFSGVPAAPRQPETTAILKNIEPLFQKIGGVPKAVKVAAAHASRMNWWYKYMAGLDHLAKANPLFTPLLRYLERVRLMHNEETRVHDFGLAVLKAWRHLGEEGDRVTLFLDDLHNMTYLSAAEVKQGIKRHPTAPEVQALRAKHKLGPNGVRVATLVRDSFEGFLALVEQNAIEQATRVITADPAALSKKISEIHSEVALMRQKPYFPNIRFGRHYVMVTDAAGRVIHFETFERKGLRSAEARQMAAATALRARKRASEAVDTGILPEQASQFIGLPPTLLEAIKTELTLTDDQKKALEQIQLTYTPGVTFRKHLLKSEDIAGYSKDFKRSYARYFFHGGRYLARVKHGWALEGDVKSAEGMRNSNKANMIGAYMRDHLSKTVLDARGDHGLFKSGIFMFAMGYSPAAATQNLYQTPMISFPFLAAKFGGIGLGDARASKALIKAMVNKKNFYRRGEYKNATQFEMQALSYGIQRGRITETQAPELAAASAQDTLFKSVAGSEVARRWHQFMEAGSLMFELAEQFNRRVVYGAALELAQKHPNSKAVKEATRVYAQEFADLQSGAAHTGHKYSAAEAAAIVTAGYMTDQTQFIYARYARPRFMRGRWPGTFLVFQKYMQSYLFLLGQNKSDFLPRHLIIMALIGGGAGLPGYDDWKDLLRAFGQWKWGRDFNLDREARKWVIAMFGDSVAPDIILHGLSRQGLGLPAFADLLGSFATGTPGRGLDAKKPGQNVPLPSFDRSKAVTTSRILPASPGAFLAASSDQYEHTVAEQVQRASGAVFSVGFNMMKMVLDNEHEWSDVKRWEKGMPRALSSASRAYRYAFEGRERYSKGGEAGAATVLNFDIRDPEQMMEVIGAAIGYMPTRLAAQWDFIMARAEVTAYYEHQKKGLMAQMFEATQAKSDVEIDRVVDKIRDYNDGLPDWAKGETITSEGLRASLKSKTQEKLHKEAGIPVKKSQRGISEEMQRLFPEATVDVRRIQ